jgi:predicted SnoaL-like aldol condensation-catalyzing enzyme
LNKPQTKRKTDSDLQSQRAQGTPNIAFPAFRFLLLNPKSRGNIMIDEKVTRNKAIVLAALTGAFAKHDLSVFDRYWDENYIQHNTFIPPFREGLRSLAAQLPAGSNYEPGMIVGEGDYVVIHGRHSGHKPVPQIIADIFRLEDGLLVEHWDAIQNEVSSGLTRSGNAQFTNPQQSE